MDTAHERAPNATWTGVNNCSVHTPGSDSTGVDIPYEHGRCGSTAHGRHFKRTTTRRKMYSNEENVQLSRSMRSRWFRPHPPHHGSWHDSQ
eukprot:6337359-Prymnesium_polylepis.1